MTVRKAFDWLADSMRFVGAMFYWNARKSTYVARGRTGRCPCQNESDDSIPGRVRCDAMVHWNRPVRFRKICPLLTSTSDGWRCSVHASDVRPFWGRFVVWIVGSLSAAYLAGGTLLLGALHVTSGAPVRLVQVLWPPSWHEVRTAQARKLFDRAIDAFARGQLREAHLSLSSAQAHDPDNYDASLMLAQIAMFERSFLSADGQFERLMCTHPANGLRTAITYHDSLLSLDRMDRLAAVCVAMAQADQARAAVWVRSALLAIRSMRSADFLAFRTTHAAAIAALAPHAQLLLRAEFEVRDGRPDVARKTLRAPFSGPLNPFYAEYQVRRAAELGAVADAQVLLDFYGPVFGEFEHQLTQFTLSATARDTTAAHVAFRAVLRAPLQGKRVERLAAALVAHPDGELYRALCARLRQESALEAASPGAGLWVAGLVCGEPNEAVYWQSHGARDAAVGFPPIGRVDFETREIGAPDSVNHLVNTLGLPRDVILELLWRVVPQDAAAVRFRNIAG